LNTSIQKTFIIFSAIFLSLMLCVVGESRAELLEDFTGYVGGKFPDDKWKVRSGNPAAIYSFVTEGQNTFLQARTKGNSIQLFRKKGWNIMENPFLSWKWRIREFPTSETKHVVKNDNAVAIYVVFPSKWFMPETIKYIWNSDLEKDRILRKRDNFPGIVIRSGKRDADKWITEERNVFEDYKKLFGRNPPNPVAFGFLSDSNESKSSSLGDYDDFVVMSRPSPVVTPVVTTKPASPIDKPAEKASPKK
jgi:hypothetical protein